MVGRGLLLVEILVDPKGVLDEFLELPTDCRIRNDLGSEHRSHRADWLAGSLVDFQHVKRRPRPQSLHRDHRERGAKQDASADQEPPEFLILVRDQLIFESGACLSMR